MGGRKPPFDVLRAAFLLLTVVICTAMAETLLAILACIWLIVVKQAAEPGSCINVAEQVRSLITEAIAAALALIVAGRNERGP